jgi:hypothetical protein
MMHRTRTTGLIAGLLLVLLVLPGAVRAEGYSLAPQQPAVDAGQALSFVGTGFTRGERVVTWITTPDQSVIGGDYAGAEGAAGRVEVSFEVPKDAIGGRWALTAYGLQSKTPVVAAFEVHGRDPASAAPTGLVAPASGPPGTQFAFAAFGYKGEETVSYWLTGPDSNIYDAYPEGADTNRDGRVDVTWTAPPTALHGIWVITIQGLKSHVARGIPFEVR